MLSSCPGLVMISQSWVRLGWYIPSQMQPPVFLGKQDSVTGRGQKGGLSPHYTAGSESPSIWFLLKQILHVVLRGGR
jgi:hypothetical protein